MAMRECTARAHIVERGAKKRNCKCLTKHGKTLYEHGNSISGSVQILSKYDTMLWYGYVFLDTLHVSMDMLALPMGMTNMYVDIATLSIWKYQETRRRGSHYMIQCPCVQGHVNSLNNLHISLPGQGNVTFDMLKFSMIWRISSCMFH
jgi:hypothetical protein